MVYKFQLNLDKESSMAKTVSSIVNSMKLMFFQESNENLRVACADTLSLILDYCFINKRIA